MKFSPLYRLKALYKKAVLRRLIRRHRFGLSGLPARDGRAVKFTEL